MLNRWLPSGGEELPGTIAGVRAGPDVEWAGEFDHEIERAPATELPLALVRRALAGAVAEEEDETLFERLARGEDVETREPSGSAAVPMVA
ncbi:hypothetical protein AB0I22_20435 [Streptomyces sp. NPDC050610]|uniref:hypothetical protein n=1 Tax=Streptomyces sp. NPDC050610 TaxID=3157097 RepID=UPI00343C7E58